jgi:hypothetical protein
MGQAARNSPSLEIVSQREVVSRAAAVAGPITATGNLSQLPASVNLSLYRGDDFSFTLPVTNPDGSAYTLTGCTALAQIRATATAPDPPTAVFTTSLATNIITLSLSNTVSAGIAVGAYVWDCQLMDASAKIHTIAAGAVTVTADVSR